MWCTKKRVIFNTKVFTPVEVFALSYKNFPPLPSKFPNLWISAGIQRDATQRRDFTSVWSRVKQAHGSSVYAETWSSMRTLLGVCFIVTLCSSLELLQIHLMAWNTDGIWTCSERPRNEQHSIVCFLKPITVSQLIKLACIFATCYITCDWHPRR